MVGPFYRAGNKEREKCHKYGIIYRVAYRLSMPPVYVKQIRHSMECIKRNAQGKYSIYKYQVCMQSYSVKPCLDLGGKKIIILKYTQGTQVACNTQPQKQFCFFPVRRSNGKTIYIIYECAASK